MVWVGLVVGVVVVEGCCCILWREKGAGIDCGFCLSCGREYGKEGAGDADGVKAEIYTCKGISPFYVNGQRSKATAT